MTTANDNIPEGVVLRHLSVLAYAQGFTLWHYHADNAGQTVHAATQSAFWLDAVGTHGTTGHGRTLLTTGDRIMVSASDGFADLGVVIADVAEPKGLAPTRTIEVVLIAGRTFRGESVARAFG